MSAMQVAPLAGKVAVVTGAAGGIGAAICDALARAGCAIALGYRATPDAARALADRLAPPAAGGAHLPVRMPVTDSAALGQAAADTLAAFGRVDILVNCAGTTRFVPHHDLDGLDDALIDEILHTNVRGPIATVRAFRAALAADGAGLVVNISSIAARTAMGSNIAYCASKAALDNLTASMARALAPAIRVLSVSPGLVDTEFVAALDPAWRDAQAAATPLGRLGSPAEVADAVLAVATLLPFSTGTVIAVDGGRPLR